MSSRVPVQDQLALLLWAFGKEHTVKQNHLHHKPGPKREEEELEPHSVLKGTT
jgi:hypothetical protein